MEDSTYWIDALNLDGYRLDVVKHIRPDFWWRFLHGSAIPSRKNFYLVGETFQSRQGLLILLVLTCSMGSSTFLTT